MDFIEVFVGEGAALRCFEEVGEGAGGEHDVILSVFVREAAGGENVDYV